MGTCVDRLELTILADNRARPGLLAEHGLSMWLEVAGRRLLLDTGDGPALAHNAPALGVPLQAADALVLSHGHDDHCGGLPFVVEQARALRVVCHPEARRERFSVRAGAAESIGMPEAARRALEGLGPARREFLTQPLELAPGVGLTGPIPRRTPFEDTGGPFFLDARGEEPDPLEDDLALWVRTRQGLVVLVGCSHAGVVNTLEHARALSGTSRIRAVLGGFHLRRASEERLARTAAALGELAPELVVPCHCSGERIVEELGRTLGARVRQGEAGARFTF